MATHSFKCGEYVVVFQLSQKRGLLIEGRAKIVGIVRDVDEQYRVKFTNDPNEVFNRYVDPDGQEDPNEYVKQFDARLASRGEA